MEKQALLNTYINNVTILIFGYLTSSFCFACLAIPSLPPIIKILYPFSAGNVNRAPRWMSEHGLEWFYRFLQEPKRMFKRYFVDDTKILKLIFKYAKKGE